MNLIKEECYGTLVGSAEKHLVRTIQHEPAPISAQVGTILAIICEKQPDVVIINGIEYFKKEGLDV